ncbi:MAG: DUF58 domain-containing protein [Methylomonas sp.]|jgi:uncharacterized protein (DUF58 family)|uniref:DUF58 domain-containing protein n=1 Tax=Methylomonas sp. TaxID=418 RepID=UPI0025F777E3|nr:DUF58 domain-containing protein [Methylomonas sp.]MCK9605495.1 DUF58 domain-containing protein [Methylomonas sp.]
MKVSPSHENERIAVSLKTLVDLAKPAATLNLRPKQIRAAQSGNYVSHFKGRGMAFAETRLYQPGDDVRRMDWRVTARTDKPHSKIFCEERERPLFISVDYRPGMAFATRGVFKSVQAAKLAALLAWAAQQQGDRIGGQIFSDAGCLELKPRSGKSALLRFFNTLAHPVYPSAAASTLTEALARLQHHAHPGSRIYVISDFRGLNQLAENHLALIARHCEVVLLHIFDPLESQLPEKGRYRFTDKIRDIILDTGEIKQRHEYHQRFHARQLHLKHLCQKLRMTLLPCSTNQSPVEVLNLNRSSGAG